jgi:type I restriction enzyme S subunit
MAVLLSTVKKHELARRAQGITIVHLYGKDIKKLSVQIPEIEEQNEIAKIYLHMRREAMASQIILARIKQQKQYLLQNLISGKIRIPENMPIKELIS